MDDSNVMHDPRDRAALLDAAIIRRLQLPVPGEPTVMPALVLPIGEGSDRLGAPRIRARFLEGSRPTWTSSPRMVLGVLALLLALVATVVGGAMRLNLIPNPFDPDAGLRARGISIEIPEGWVRLTPPDPSGSSGAFTALIASNMDVTGCAEDDLPAATPTPEPQVGEDGVVTVDGNDFIGGFAGRADETFACMLGKEMAPGEIRVVVSAGYPQRAQLGPIESFDPTDWFGERTDGGQLPYVPTAADGWTDTIDGSPAKLIVSQGGGAVGATEVRTWAVFGPSLDTWFIRLHLRGPDMDALRERADTIARSFAFDLKRPVLDPAVRDEMLARAIDDLDRETRTWRGSDIFGCFPRTPGERPGHLEDRLFEYGPDGPLVEPVPVTCSTSVEATPLNLWVATLVISWDAGDGYPSGQWGWYVQFDMTGPTGSTGQLFGAEDLVSPGSVGMPPPPLNGPLVIQVGSIVQVLPPGIDWTLDAYRALESQPHERIGPYDHGGTTPGRRFYVVDGPVSHVGTDWYLLEVSVGAGYPSPYGWFPATDGPRPLLAVVEPRCPSGAADVLDLLDMIPAERMLCFGTSEITLDPSLLVRVDLPGGSEGIEATPAWLASDTPWRLFGRSGPDGVDPGLAVAIDPSLGDNVPTGAWLSVRGHFNDAASSTCHRTLPEGWGTVETPEIQVLKCRELFVITGYEPRPAP